MNATAPRPADEAWPADAVEVGVVLGAWSIKGGFKVQPHAADPQALFATKRWWLREGSGAQRLLKIVQAREQGGSIVASAQEVLERNAAEALRGARVFISRTSFPSAGEDEYYWVDLIGLAVLNREGEALGQVADLIDTGVHSVLRVVADDTTERLIPFVAAYVDDVNLPARRIVVDWGADY